VDRDSSVSISTYSRLDGLGIGSRWGARFPHPSRPSFLYSGYWVSFPGVKRPVRGVDHPPPSTEVKERAELYRYSRSGP
jgi:hypothetical protein